MRNSYSTVVEHSLQCNSLLLNVKKFFRSHAVCRISAYADVKSHDIQCGRRLTQKRCAQACLRVATWLGPGVRVTSHPVLRGRGDSDIISLPNQLGTPKNKASPLLWYTPGKSFLEDWPWNRQRPRDWGTTAGGTGTRMGPYDPSQRAPRAGERVPLSRCLCGTRSQTCGNASPQPVARYQSACR